MTIGLIRREFACRYENRAGDPGVIINDGSHGNEITFYFHRGEPLSSCPAESRVLILKSSSNGKRVLPTYLDGNRYSLAFSSYAFVDLSREIPNPNKSMSWRVLIHYLCLRSCLVPIPGPC